MRRRVDVEVLEVRRLLASYHVDPDGSDDNDGLSPETAWRTIDRVNTFSFAGGDRVLFEAGSTFPGNLAFGPDDAGRPDAFITVGTYPGDHPGEARATILAGAGDGLSAVNTSGLFVTGLNFVGSGQRPHGGSGIRFDNNLPADVKLPFVRVDNVEVSGFGNYGITVGGSSGKSGFSDVRITRARVHHNVVGGIETHGEFTTDPAAGYAHADVYVGHCTVHDNAGYARSRTHVGDGIMLSDVDGAVIERCEAYNNGSLNTHAGGPVGIWAWDANRVTIQHNESHHNRTAGRADGGGFDLDGGVTNSVMQYNYSHDNDGAGYGLYQFAGARPFGNNVVRYNISAHDGRRNGYAGIELWSAGGTRGVVRDVQVYNNTVVMSRAPQGAPRAVYFRNRSASVTVRNNIFHTSGGAAALDVRGVHPGLTFQGNNYSTSGGPLRLRRNARVFRALAAWRNATGHERLDGRVTGSEVDPMLIAPDGDGTVGNPDLLESFQAYRLPPKSPLAAAGLNLWAELGIDPGRRDFFGTPLPTTPEQAGDFAYAVGAFQPPFYKVAGVG